MLLINTIWVVSYLFKCVVFHRINSFYVLYMQGLIRLLSTISSGSLKAVKTLLELNISSTLKDILNINGAIHARALLNNEHTNQVLIVSISYIFSLTIDIFKVVELPLWMNFEVH